MYEVTMTAHYGYHLHDLVMMKINYIEVSKWRIANSFFYNPILGLVKASMILLYLRLGGTKNGVRIACYVLFAVNLGHAAGTFIANAMQCLPFAYNWNGLAIDIAAQIAVGATDPGMTPFGQWPTGFKNGKYVTGGRCFNIAAFLLTASGIAILTDLLILLIPVYMVYDLKLAPRKKLIVLLILCLGIGVTAVGVARFIILYYEFHPVDEDANYSVRSTISQIEVGLALITGCVPDLFPLLRHFFPEFLRESTQIDPNPYPYDGISDTTSYVQRARKFLSTSTNNRSTLNMTGNERISEITLENIKLRDDVVTTGEVQVKGAASINSVTESQEGIIEQVTNKNEGIVKTTQFVIQETEAQASSRSWSNV